MKRGGWKLSDQTKLRMGAWQRGERNNNWAGDAISYRGLHRWLADTYGKADRCENQKCDGTSRAYHWAKLKGRQYARKRGHFIRLCVKCHNAYDRRPETARTRRNRSIAMTKSWQRRKNTTSQKST